MGIYRPGSYPSMHDTRSHVFARLVNLQHMKKKNPKPKSRLSWHRKRKPAHESSGQLSRLESLPSEIIDNIINQVFQLRDIANLGRTCPRLATLVYARYTRSSSVGTWANLPLLSVLCDFGERNLRRVSRLSYEGLPLPDLPEDELSVSWDVCIYDTSGREGDSRYLLAQSPWGTDRFALRSSKTPCFEKSLYTALVPDFKARAGRRWLLRNHTKSVVVRLRLSQDQQKDAMPRVVVNGGTKLPLDLLLMICTRKSQSYARRDTGLWCGDCFDIVPDTKQMRHELRESGWRDSTESILYYGRSTLGMAIEYRKVCRSPLHQVIRALYFIVKGAIQKQRIKFRVWRSKWTSNSPGLKRLVKWLNRPWVRICIALPTSVVMVIVVISMLMSMRGASQLLSWARRKFQNYRI